MTLGRLLRGLRERMGVSQASIGASAQVSQGYLCQLEREEVKNPSAAILLRLAVALEVNPNVLLVEAGYDPRNPTDDWEPPVNIDLVKFLARLPREQQRRLLRLFESLERLSRTKRASLS